MPENIETSTSVVMTGKRMARNYLQMQKLFSGLYMQRFYRTLSECARTGRFLEIGSGPAFQTAEVMRRFHPAEIIAVEPSLDMISVAAEYIMKCGYSDRVKFVEGFVEDGSLIRGLGQFDLVYSTLSMHHWASPSIGLANLYQALKPEGIMVIFDFRLTHGESNHNKQKPPQGMESEKTDIQTVLLHAGIKKFELQSGLLFQTILVSKNL